MADKRAAVLFAEGFEEIEAITVVDVLRRAGVLVLVQAVVGDDAAARLAAAMQVVATQ